MPDEIQLSPQQRRLWLAGEAAASVFHARCEILIEGPLDPEALRAALERRIVRHEILRTTYQRRPWLKVALQVVEDSLPLEWRWLDPKTSGDEIWESDRRQAFNLERGPMLRATLARRDRERWTLLLSLPALSADARSLSNLAAEVADDDGVAASGARASTDGDPGAEPLQYGDFAEWQLEILEDGAGVEEGRNFWKRHALREPPGRCLPFETPVDSVARRPASLSFELPSASTDALESSARAWDTSPANVLLTAWQLLLQRLADTPETVVGTVFDGRDPEDLADALGLYARCLPVAGRLDPRLSFRDAVARVATAVERAREWQPYCRWDEDLGLAGHAPVSAFGFEYGAGWERRSAGRRWTLRRREVWNERFRVKLSGVRHPEALKLHLAYDPEAFTGTRIRRLGRQIESLLERATRDGGDLRLGELTIATPAELRALDELDDSAAELPPARPFRRLFEEHAARHPRRPALVCGERRLTYAELDARAQRLARRLRSSGVGPEVRVAILADRSVETVVAILAVLEAGGAYVPLDPASPAERLAGMLADSGAALALTRSEQAAKLPEETPRLLLDGDTRGRDADAAEGSDGTVVPRTAGLGHLAYVIFTSGSTGRPKGVAVEHRQLACYLRSILPVLRPEPGESFVTVSTFAADLGHTMVFPALATGGCLHVLPPDLASDAAALADYFAREKIDFLKIVPSHLAALATAAGLEPLLPRRALVLGGEAAGGELLGELREAVAKTRIFNHYGPTETTVGATVHRVAGAGAGGALPLGRALPGVRVRVLDRHGWSAPLEVPGEILVGGGGVARGYLGHPGRTAARFVPDPWSDVPGARAYRTGDLGLLRPAGRLEFLGRRDDQVKLRGFRIELGEIETALRGHPAVAECAVVVRADRPGERRLVGYVALGRGAAFPEREVRAELEGRLPAYMVPSALVELDNLPLTANGKVDRVALSRSQAFDPRDRGTSGRDAGRSAAAPKAPVEELLVDIWSRVLGLEEIGIHDNFFELGGDSIQVIEIVARAAKAGVRFQPQQLFQHQTVADLAPKASFAAEIVAEQGEVVGEAPLTPIQRWFFDLEPAVPGHWNQAVLARPREQLDERSLRDAFRHLLRHHDALRARFEPLGDGLPRSTGNRWRQSFAGAGPETPCVRIDLSGLPGTFRGPVLERCAAQAQGSLDLARGPLVRGVFFDFGAGHRGRLLVVVHHLAIDGVSWRILLQDLTDAYRALAAGRVPDLPAKTTSFKTWAERLAAHARSGAHAGEVGFWSRSAGAAALPVDCDDPGSANDVASLGTVARELDEPTTTALLREAPKAYRTRVNDLLLAALLRTLAGWTGERAVRLDLEGHGREDLFEDVDLSRTVGWFTTHFPVRLKLPVEQGPAAVIKSVKEQLRAVPSHGIGFGLLRYLGDEEEAARLAALPRPEISFNYLGQLDPSLSGAALFEPAEEPAGPTHASGNRRPYLLQVVSEVLDGRLRTRWLYSENRHHRETLAALVDTFLEHLRELVEHCCGGEAGGWTPSDFPLAEIDQKTLDTLAAARSIEDVYPLSPLQEGLLFHTLYAPGEGFYVGQLDGVLEGEIDIEALTAAWRTLVRRHPIFRTAFLWEGLRRPMQVVETRVELPLATDDWRSLAPAERERRLAAHLERDRAEGYDLSRAPLMRLWLFRIAENAYHLVWSHHHLLLDGWSVALLTRELFHTYDALRSGGEVDEPAPSRPYRDYIEWMAAWDLEAARRFWTESLRGFRRPTSLTAVAAGAGTAASGGLADRWLIVPEASTAKLTRWLRSEQLTVGTFVHGLWGLLLSFYSGDRDVVFGTTVAGRPTDLTGFESMVGLFINTLPVRVQVSPEDRLASWLRTLQERQVEMRGFEATPLAELQKWCQLPAGTALFESVLVVENYPEDDETERAFSVRDSRYFMQENFPLIFTVNPGSALELKIKYETSVFSGAAIERLAAFFETLFERLAEYPDVELEQLLARLAETGQDHRRRGLEELEDVRRGKLGKIRRKTIGAS